MKLFKKVDCLALGQFQEGNMSEKEIPACLHEILNYHIKT
jgi:hypothetical protein